MDKKTGKEIEGNGSKWLKVKKKTEKRGEHLQKNLQLSDKRSR